MEVTTGKFNYTIEKADITDPEVDLTIRKLIMAAFKEETLQPAFHVLNNIDSKASRPSFMLVAKEDGQIIGCNAFIANDFHFYGKSVVGYQSCWTATHPEHQGKKVFVNIINEAKRLLKEEGAGFLYGLPNDNSYPIFVKKLGFAEIDTMHARVINLPFFRPANLQSYSATLPQDALVIDEEQLYVHKRKQKGDKILRADVGKGFIWGKIEKRKKYGIGFHVFIVGGISYETPEQVKTLFKAVFKKYKVSFAELISCKTNTVNRQIREWKKAASLNPFIYFNLNMPDQVRQNFMFGSIDVF